MSHFFEITANEFAGLRTPDHIRQFRRQIAAVLTLPVLLLSPLPAQQEPVGVPMQETRLCEWGGGHWNDLGTLSDWERNHSQTNGTFSPSPEKTAEQMRQEQGELDKTKGLDAISAGNYELAITLLSQARESLPQDTTITEKLREARTELTKRMRAEADATRRRVLDRAIQAATASLEAVFATPTPQAALPTAWGDPMVVDLTDARTLTVDPSLLSGLHLDPLPPPPTGFGARPPEPNPQRIPKPTDDQILAFFSSQAYEDLFFEYQFGQLKVPTPSPRLHELIEESLKLLDTVPMRPIQVKGSVGFEELEATRPLVAKAVEAFRTRFHQLHYEATLQAMREFSDFLQQLEDDGWWKKGEDIQKAIAADPQLSRAVEDEIEKSQLRMLDYHDAAAATAYAGMASQMRTILAPRTAKDIASSDVPAQFREDVRLELSRRKTALDTELVAFHAACEALRSKGAVTHEVKETVALRAVQNKLIQDTEAFNSDVAVAAEQHAIRSLNALAKDLKWSADERKRLSTALDSLDADGSESNTAQRVQAWKDIMARESGDFSKDTAGGNVVGFPSAGTQSFQDCAVYALANATGVPYEVVAARAAKLINEGDHRSALERADAQKTIEDAGLTGGEVIMLAEAMGEVEIVGSEDFAKTIQEGRPVMVNVIYTGGRLNSAHEVVLTRSFERSGETWYEMIDSNQGEWKRLYLRNWELDLILKERGVAFRPDTKTTPPLLR